MSNHDEIGEENNCSLYTNPKSLRHDISITEFNNLDHLSDDMKDEVSINNAKDSDIIEKVTNSRSKQKCQLAMNNLFPKGRVFSSVSQLSQMAAACGSSWGFTTAREGFSIRYVHNIFYFLYCYIV